MGELRIIIPEDVHRRLRQMSLDKDKPIKVLVPEIIVQYLDENKKKDIGKKH